MQPYINIGYRGLSGKSTKIGAYSCRQIPICLSGFFHSVHGDLGTMISTLVCACDFSVALRATACINDSDL